MRDTQAHLGRRAAAASSARDRLALLGELRHAGPGPLAALIVTQSAVSAVPALTALTTENLVNRLLGGEPVTAALIALGVVILLGRLAQVATAPIAYLVSQRVDLARRSALTGLASRMPLAMLEQSEIQQRLRLAQADPEFWAERTPGQGATAQLDLVVRWIGVLAAASVLAAFSWVLAPLVIVPALLSRSIWRRQFMEHIEIERAGVLAGIAADHWRQLALTATDGKESRTFGLQGWAVERWSGQLTSMYSAKWHAGLRSVREQWKIAAVVAPPLIAAFALTAWQAGRPHGNVGVAAAVLGGSWSILNLLSFADALEIEGAVPGCRAYARLRADVAAVDRTGARPATVPPPAAGGEPTAPLVRFEDVSFAYGDSAPTVLDRLNLEIRPGELLAIVGLNGAGKSTLIKLLSGLYRPTGGRITVDGIDLTRLDHHRWRSRLSVVFQGFVRYPLSLLDNVALGYGAVPADAERVRLAAAESGLDDIASRLKANWDTPLTRSRSGGVDLSGGEWQKVVLTRALYALRSGARLLVLDEPTAHLDVMSEFDVFRQLAARKREAGVVLISHRLSTVRLADRIVLLDGGRIAESGTHAELMLLDGTYARLFRTQAERFNHGFEDHFDQGVSV